MQQGVLYFEGQTERMDIRFENKKSMAACTAELQWRS